MKKNIGLAVILFGLFSIITLFPQMDLNAGPQIIPPRSVRSAVSVRKNVTIRLVEVGTRQPIVGKYLQIHKYMLVGSGNYLHLSSVTAGYTDRNGEFKVRLPRTYVLDATEADLDEDVSSFSYFVRLPIGLGFDSSEPEPKRYYEFDMIIRSDGTRDDASDEELNYPEVTIVIWLPSPDQGSD